MNTKKYIIAIGVIGAVLVGATSVVLAENLGQNMELMKIKESKDMAVRVGTEMVLQVNHQGKVLMRGSIESVGTSSLTVKSWGGSWVVNIGPNTKLLPGTDLSQFKVGNFVGVQGSVNEGSPWTVDALIVRDWAAKKALSDDDKETRDVKEDKLKDKKDESSRGVQQQIQSILDQIKKIQAQIDAQQGR